MHRGDLPGYKGGYRNVEYEREDGEEKYGKYVYEVSGRKKEGAYFKLR